VCNQALSDIPLPSGWPDSVRSAVIYVISLAHYAIATTRGWAANSINARLRLAAQNDRLKHETELLRELSLAAWGASMPSTGDFAGVRPSAGGEGRGVRDCTGTCIAGPS